MMTSGTRRITGWLLIGVPILFSLFFALLQAAFDYPDILRRPAEEILTRFNAGGPGLVGLWYGFALTSALLLPAAVLLRRAFGPGTALLDLATPLALAATLVQLLGLIRWPLLVPTLARNYADPATDPTTRTAVVIVFQAFHQYAGVAVGEHLGYLFTAAWTAVIAVGMLRTAPFRPSMGWAGLIVALGIAAGMLEPAGVVVAGTVNAVSYALWSLWLIGAGVALLRSRTSGPPPLP